ncbi:plasmid mobilization protein [Lactococcus lactis]|uniref:plasmid mobilization protein n=2 Tax=Streptococcaceae TaxID=1300 RepID=UPI0028A1EEA9|nr:plasmid mobilization relaxosome protein MobC [Lactococcus lactis]
MENLLMNDAERFRNKHVHFMATSDEKAQLERNKLQAGYQTLGSYLLKMGLEGIIINVDFSELRGALGDIGSLRNEFNRIGNNINQVTKHVNESKEIDAMDLYLLQEEVNSMKDQIEHFERNVVDSFNEKLRQLGVD